MTCGGIHLGFPIGIKNRGPSNDHSWAVWFQLSKWFQRRSVVPLYTDYIRLRDHIQWWYSKWRLECEFEDLSGPIRCKIGIWYFSTMNTALRRKSRNWLMWNQDNLSKWYNMSTCGSMFLWAGTTCLSSTDIISSNGNIKQQHSLKVKVEGHISKYCILWWWTTIFVTRHYKIKSKKYTRTSFTCASCTSTVVDWHTGMFY
jgi:hypothetical protein